MKSNFHDSLKEAGCLRIIEDFFSVLRVNIFGWLSLNLKQPAVSSQKRKWNCMGVKGVRSKVRLNFCHKLFDFLQKNS